MDGLLNTVAAGVETAFELASELVLTGVYTKVLGNSTYDPVTDELTPDVENIPDVRFIQVGVDLEEREASPVSITDSKFLIPGVDLKGYLPGETDYFVLETGERWNVLVSRPTPGKKLIIVFGRRA
jgi:hypothetical protein